MQRITSRVDAITHIPPSYLGEILPPPKSVKIELTGRCNYACTFCARSHMLRKQEHMDFTFFKSVTYEMRQCGVEELGLFYLGESFLYPHLVDACRHAKEYCGYPYVFLTTNGSLSTPDKLRALFEARLDSLKFSLNYSDREQFEDIARVKGVFFDRMICHIKAAKALRDEVMERTGHRCGLYASYILYDGDQGQRMKTLVDELSDYLDEIYELPLYNQASLVTKDEEARGWKASPGNRGRAGNLVQPLPCWAVLTEGHVTWDGKLAACCFSHTDDFTMADLHETSFMAGWNSTKFQALRRANLAKDVRGTPCEACVLIG